MTDRLRVAVIGGGIAGLASAALLAREGHQVDLLEQQPTLGGRIGSWEADGFRFDTGPSWYLMPEVFDHFFSLFGTSADEALGLSTLDPGYRVFFEGVDQPLDVHASREANIAAFDRVEPGAGRALGDYLDSARDVYGMALRQFLYSSFDSAPALLKWDLVRRTPRLARLLTRSLQDHVAERFTDRRLRQVLGYPAVFLGTSPDRAPSMYHLMSHLDLADGVRYPAGGFVRLADAVADLAVGAGARLHTAATVTEITTAPRRGRLPAGVTGVRWTDAEGVAHDLAADLVVGTADLHHLETQLLPPELQTFPQSYWDRRDPGPGAVLVCLGVEGELPELAHHSLFFTADWHRNFEDVFGSDRRVPDPASAYVCKPSATDPTVAPPGCENLFVLVPVPADVSIGCGGVDGDGDPAVEKAADAAIDQVASWAGIGDLRSRIVVRRTFGPGDFAADFNAWSGGALGGPAHTLRQSAMFRAGNVSRKVAGLHYAGAGTIPGIGLPMCLISAQLVVKRLRGDRSSDPLDAGLAG